jgi:hypothetical protein
MSLRIGFDMDGVLADFASAYRDVAATIPGTDEAGPPVQAAPENASDPGAVTRQPEAAQEPTAAGEGAPAEPSDPGVNAYEQRRRREAVWAAIERTPDFWTTLKPTRDGAVRRLHALMMEHRWEVFFITQRPETAGETVQRQTQRWLVDQGFDLPSVLVIHGSRGAAAAALRLDFHVDDTTQHCLDVMTGSTARTILISAEGERVAANVRKLGIGTAASIDDALDILEQATAAQANPSLFRRLARLIGWQVANGKG